MGDVINLNKARKARARSEQQRQAEENRLKFGRTKVEKKTEVAEADRSNKDLDGKKLD